MKEGHKLKGVWQSVRAKCRNPKAAGYWGAGGLGVEVCEEWDNFEKFEEWAIETGYRENAGMMLLRKDKLGDYCPDNCYWGNRRDAQRSLTNNVRFTFNGRAWTLPEFIREFGVSRYAFYRAKERYGGISEEMLQYLVNKGPAN